MVRLGPGDGSLAPGHGQSVVVTGVALAAGTVGAAELAAVLFLAGPVAAAPIALAVASGLALALVIHRLSRARTALVVAALAALGGSTLFAWRLGWTAHGELLALALVAAALLDRRASVAFRATFAALVTAGAGAAVVAAASSRTTLAVGATAAAVHAATTVVLLALAAWVLALSLRRAEEAVDDLRRASRLDPLTGLLDRHAVKETMDYEAARSRRNGLPFAVLVAEVDDLDGLGARHGLRCRDWVLVTSANLLRRVLRQQDHMARWAGDRFLALLPDTDGDGGRIAAERIRAEIQRSSFLFDGREVDFTVTLGVATVAGGRGLAACLDQLEQAVAAGAAQGGDQVVVMAAPSPTGPRPDLGRDPFADDEQSFTA